MTLESSCLSVELKGLVQIGRSNLVKLRPKELGDWKRMDIIYFIKCTTEIHKQELTGAKINGSPISNVHRSYLKNLPPQENLVRAYLEIMSPEETAKAPFNTDRPSLWMNPYNTNPANAFLDSQC